MVIHVNNSLSGCCFLLALRLTIVRLDVDGQMCKNTDTATYVTIIIFAVLNAKQKYPGYKTGIVNSYMHQNLSD